MATGEVARPDAVVVERIVDAPPDEIVDHLTEFALRFGLQVDRRHEGAGMRFTRKAEVPVEDKELFRTGDALLVLITPESAGGSLLTCSATMEGLHQRGDDWKRGRTIRGLMLSGLFVYLGVQGLTPRVGLGDFVMFGLAGMFGVRTYRAVTNEDNDRRDFEDDVHRALVELCDRIESGEELD